MRSRLVLGVGPTALTLLDALGDGGATQQVVTTDEYRAATLREAGIAVTEADQTDPEVLDDLGMEPATVVVCSEDPATNLAAARLAADRFPEAFRLVYAGREATDAQRADLAAVADRLVDPQEVISDRLNEVIGTEAARIHQIQRVFRNIDGHLAIVTHDNPDPDAIASAVALGLLAERTGCRASVCYYGDISHQENRALVNLLSFDLELLEPGDSLDEFDGFALVDHSRPGVNDQLPSDLPIDIVIDHHPPRAPVEARFVDLRSEVGATSTLLVDYLERFGVAIPETVATGLLFGIFVDTKEFRREACVTDFEAAAFLLPHADMKALQRIEDPSVTPDTVDTIGRAIDARQREGAVLLSCVGYISDRDALAQAADRLLDMEGIQATVVYGVMDGTIYASARARGAGIDLGEVLRDAFGQIGSAGGHADMAGAQIEMGILEEIDDREESLETVVSEVVADRFLYAVQSRSNRLLGGAYVSSDYGPETLYGGLATDRTLFSEDDPD